MFSFDEKESKVVIESSHPAESGVSDIIQGLYFARGRAGLTWAAIQEAVGEQITTEELILILKSDSFYARLARRGIPWAEGWTPDINDRELWRDRLTPQQSMALMVMTNPADKRTAKAKLQTVGITYNTWRTWLANPYFAEMVKDAAEKMLQDNIATVHTSLVGKAAVGDVNAIKLFYELTGRHDPARQQMLDIQKVLELVLESLQRHVTEPKILLAVTTDMDRILNGKDLKQIDTMPANYVEEAEIVVDAEEVPGVPDGFFDFDFKDK